jgi:hypothetical protein
MDVCIESFLLDLGEKPNRCFMIRGVDLHFVAKEVPIEE